MIHELPEPLIYVGGAFVPQSEAKISVLDHAVLYGDGVFETVVAWNGRIFKLRPHVDRFYRSLAAIGLEAPMDRAGLEKLVVEAVRRNGLRSAYIKWILTRGSNGRPLMDPWGCVPNLIILVQPYVVRASDERLRKGLRAKTSAIRRPSGDVLPPQVKSLNYLNLILARMEAKAAGADEAVMLDARGRLCEAPGYNIFVVREDGVLRTPVHDILEGITRETVMTLAAEAGMRADAADLELYDAYTANEMFLSSTAGGLIPIVEIDGRRIGAGVPGPAWKRLAAAYEALLDSDRFGTPVFP
jgi:branched-chain amino acid aminotransferase